jgi:hypothetical protein
MLKLSDMVFKFDGEKWAIPVGQDAPVSELQHVNLLNQKIAKAVYEGFLAVDPSAEAVLQSLAPELGGELVSEEVKKLKAIGYFEKKPCEPSGSKVVSGERPRRVE